MATIQIPTLPAASLAASGDLLHLRQGTTDKKLDVDILKSFVLDGQTLDAATVLALIKTVDGAGSGLDADLLDGQHGAFYQDAATLEGEAKAFFRNAGNLNAGIVADARLPSGSISKTTNGFIKLPAFLGGLILQWGRVSISANTNTTISFPTPFDTAALAAVASYSFALLGNGFDGYSAGASPLSTTQLRIWSNTPPAVGSKEVTWFCVGH